MAVVAMFALLGIAILAVSLWLEHKSETTLPTPTGPHMVGRTTYVWSDARQADPFAPEPDTKRELLAWIWYPAAARQSPNTVEDYLPAPWRTAVECRRSALMTLLTRDLSRVRPHSIRDSDLSPQHCSYPVLVMRAGLAALTTDYTTLAEDLASHGYVVVGFDAPYRTAVVVGRDGRVIARTPQNDAKLVGGPQQDLLIEKLLEGWTADIAFALDQLEQLNAFDPCGRFMHRLDLQRVGVFGHSLGGAAALQFCRNDSRCKAGIDVDGAPRGSVIADGVTQSFMFLLSDHGSKFDADNRRIEANIRSIYERLPTDRRLGIMIRGANHFNFSDGSVLRSQLLMRALRALGIIGIDGRGQLALTTHCIRSFFDVHLKGHPASTLESQLDYPEIQRFD